MHEHQRTVKCECVAFVSAVEKQRWRITQCLAVQETSEAEKAPVTAVLHEQMSLDYDIPKVIALTCT